MLRLLFLVFIGFFFSPAPTHSSTYALKHFPSPPSLSDEVRFWKTVFGTYDRRQVLLHDDKCLNVLYQVLDFSKIGERKDLSPKQKEEIIRTQVVNVREKITVSLEHLAQGVQQEKLTPEEKYYEKMFLSCSLRLKKPLSAEYREAQNRIRVQVGQRSNLQSAIAKSTQTLGDIEAVFESYGLPGELTALMFIESMFNPKALSEIGASGLWQFMPKIGKEYVPMNSFWDGRNDPIHASDGAARLLKDLHRRTGDWGLAVNSYHSGLGRIEKAWKKLKTKDIAVIIHEYDDPAYGFWSRNYYPEFLAVAEILKWQKETFGTPENDLLEQYDIVKTPDFLNLPEMAGRLAIDMKALRRLNPAIRSEVFNGGLPLPPGYPLKVPKGMGYPVALATGHPP
ncbi:MAG: lytic transglycosylase domain-containing protein [Deltaproteobacteria bacterium]|nr:lytic transglycosylase domain-containing protein [Deltaproteobacteria bacterium]